MRYLSFALAGLAMLLSACGGGSDGSFTPAQTIGPPPTIASGTLPGATTGATYAGYTFTVDQGGTAPYYWSSPDAPAGLYVDSTGLLGGVPATAGTFSFTVMVTDSGSPATQSATRTFSLQIADSPITISTDPVLPAATHGVSYGLGFSSTGGSAPLSWHVSGGALPPGMTLGTDGTLGGTPTTANQAPYQFTVTVTDNYASAPQTSSAQFSLTVNEPPPPAIYGYAPFTATVGTPYSFAFSASDGLAPLVWSASSATLGGLVFSSDGVLGGTPTSAGIYPVTLSITDALHQGSAPVDYLVRIAQARPAASFTPVASMSGARTGHTATRLLDGRVLIAGGGTAAAELYDPASHSFSAAGSMTVSRTAHSGTLLASASLPNYGKVLVVGGGTTAAELFDPTTGAFTAAGNTLALHQGHSAALLQDGKVLIAGGGTVAAELYDPATGTFAATGDMTEARSGHTATLLNDGRVLIVGGDETAEIYDPHAGTFSLTGGMHVARAGHTAALLPNGKVLITGPNNSAEQFDPVTGTFAMVGEPTTAMSPVPYGIYRSTATVRSDGTVLVVGGRYNAPYGQSTSAAIAYAPEAEGYVPAGDLTTARDGHTATLLLDGSVLIAGGTHHAHHCVRGWGCYGTDLVLASAELYQ